MEKASRKKFTMNGISAAVKRILEEREGVVAKREELRRLMGAVEVRLRSIVEDLGNPTDPFTGDPLLSVTHEPRPENEHSITLRVAKDWVFELGIHDREPPLVIEGNVVSEAFGLYTFTNVRDVPGWSDHSINRIVGVGEESGTVVFYEFARPDADNLQSVKLENIVLDFLNAVEWRARMDVLNYNRQPKD
jgi:hypothetical protein